MNPNDIASHISTWIHANTDSIMLFGGGVITGGMLFGGHAHRAYRWGYGRYRRWRGYY